MRDLVRYLILALAMPAFPAGLDLSRAIVVTGPGLSAPDGKAVALLVEEVEARTGIRWPVREGRPGDVGPTVSIAVAPGGPAEGYRIRTESGGVAITGNDSRGVLFGAGRLLRAMRMGKGRAVLPGELNLASAPVLATRGHQLGYRPVNNTYDAWTLARYEQYIRDLAVFGANTVEMTMPGAAWYDSPHFPIPAARMLVEISRLCGQYGLDVSLWYPAEEKDYSDPAAVTRCVDRWERMFARLPHVDAVFVPGGDPGHTPPKHLFPFLERAAAALHRHHPKAQMWVSPQGMDDEWLAEFYALLAKRPAWLTGVVHGPWVRVGVAELRGAVPPQYPIRLYPDITHTMRCQFPMPDWDRAYALTYVREPINPLPLRQRRIFEEYYPGSTGFVTYSDGANDDVNKIVWTALGWDPKADVAGVVREYARYFAGIEGFAEGVMALERNWRGPLAANPGVETTLRQFQEMERTATPAQLGNWRFQQALYRAYSDVYTRRRLIRETALEQEALEHLRSAAQAGSLAAMKAAERTLTVSTAAPELRSRVFELGAALYQSVGMQLSVKLYQGAGWERGVTLDTVDEPLNNRRWLLAQFARVRGLADEEERVRSIQRLLDWANPGPGGFYDDIGNPAAQPHLVPNGDLSQQSFWDPHDGPLSWFDHATSWRGKPIRLRYTGLDPEARYRVRVVYAGENICQEQGIRLMANESIVVHPYMRRPLPVRPVEFEIPPEATRSGELTLTWDREQPPSGRIRGAQVAEVWLIRR